MFVIHHEADGLAQVVWASPRSRMNNELTLGGGGEIVACVQTILEKYVGKDGVK